MKLARHLSVLAFTLLLAVAASAQHHVGSAKVDYDPEPGGGDPDVPEGCAGIAAKVQITGSSTAFSPSTVTIDKGQPVCWTWSTGVSHNVKGNDGSFSSGTPSTSGNFKRTFNDAGSFGFHCQVHGSPTGGMRGTVVVRETDDGGGGSGPGTLSLDPAAYTIPENGGPVTLTVTRTGGTDGKVTVKLATGTGSASKGKDFVPRNAVLTWPAGDGNPRSVNVTIKNDSLIEGDETFRVALSKPTGGATIGTASATVTIDDDEGCPSALAAPAALKASGAAAEIRLSWGTRPTGATLVHIERRRGAAGELREIASVPAAATSFVDAGLPRGEVFHYRLRAEGAGGFSDYSAIAAGATDGSTGPCAEDAHTLCLGNGRFEAKVAYRPGVDAPARPATRTALAEAPGSGLFSFAPPSSPATASAAEAQVLLNVLDGCAVNGRYWVYLAAVTDVELDVAVRDAQTGRTWLFHNPAGKAAEVVRDVDAFASCP